MNSAGQDLGGRGLSDTVYVDPADLDALAQRVHEISLAASQTRAAVAEYLIDPALTRCASRDWASSALAIRALEDALDGHGSLRVCAAQAGELESQLHDASKKYKEQSDADGVLHKSAGLLSKMGHFALDQLSAPLKQASAVAHGLNDLRQRHYNEAWQDALAGNPGVLQPILSGLNFAVDAVFDEGSPRVTSRGADASASEVTPPRALGDLMCGLSARDDATAGEIDVRCVSGADGSRCWIVDIPGTSHWDLTKRHNANATNIGSDAIAVDGDESTYEDGVLEAMRQAGIRSGEPVMLVGHSLGGMVAVNAARRATATGAFNVTHVLTAGAPVGKTVGKTPSSVRVLALENTNDTIPRADFASNPTRTNIATIRRREGGVFGSAHSLKKSYVPMASELDADGSADEFLTSADQFLDGDSVTTDRYSIQRTFAS